MPQLRASWPELDAGLRALRLGSRGAAHARQRRRRPAARGGHAVVHDRVRARHRDHVPADPRLRAGARAHRAARAGRAAGRARRSASIDAEPGKIIHELRRGRAAEVWFPRYYGSVDSTPLFLVLLSETWRWTADDCARPRARACDADGAAVDRRVGRPRRRRLRGVPASLGRTASRSSPGRTRPTRSASPTAASPTGPIAASEVQGYVYDAKRRCAELARAVLGDAALAERLEREADELRERFDRAFWVERTAASMRSRWTTTNSPSTAAARTWGTCSGAGSCRMPGWPTSPAHCSRRRCGQAGACAPCRPRMRPTGRSPTTTAPSGHTTTPCARTVSHCAARARRRCGSCAACSRLRASSTAASPRSSRGCRAATRRSPSRIRPRRARRRGPPERPSCFCASCSGSSPIPSSERCPCAPSGLPEWAGHLTLAGLPAFGSRFDVHLREGHVEIVAAVEDSSAALRG